MKRHTIMKVFKHPPVVDEEILNSPTWRPERQIYEYEKVFHAEIG